MTRWLSPRIHGRGGRVAAGVGGCRPGCTAVIGGGWLICPFRGRPVVVWLTVRRFFSDHVDCSAGTFVEQVPGLTERHARRSASRQGALVVVGLALAGRAGSRLAASLGTAVSRSTLLRLIRGLPDPPIGRVTVLGVDEFALRRRPGCRGPRSPAGTAGSARLLRRADPPPATARRRQPVRRDPTAATGSSRYPGPAYRVAPRNLPPCCLTSTEPSHQHLANPRRVAA